MAPPYPLVLHLLPSSGLVLEHSLDNGSLLNQESSGNSLLNAGSAARTTVSPVDGLLTLGKGSVLTGSEDGDTRESKTTVTALGGRSNLLQVVNDQLASGSLDDPPPVGGGVVRLSLAESDSLGHFWSVVEEPPAS